jgi:uncharacterized protein (TIGR02594 family)
MQSVIDVAMDVGSFAAELRQAGVRTVIRYYNHRNSSRLPTKRLEKSEAEALTDAGLSLAAVFQQRGGSDGNIGDLSHANGVSDARRALELASDLRQPENSAIYFAVDHDYFRRSELDQIRPYFEAVKAQISDRYRIGLYGSGTVGAFMQRAGLIDLVWLAGAVGWSGTRSMLETGAWTLFQKELHKNWPGGRFQYDGNITNPAFPDIGQFSLGETGATNILVNGTASAGSSAATLMKVIARSGLKLRRGPGTDFPEITTLPEGTLVTALDRIGDWIKVDLESDSHADGFMHGGFLQPVSGGLPLPTTPGSLPVDIARAELALDVREVPGAQHNPRIVMYHASTSTGRASDEVPWCSSFVNYCVEKAGLIGTGSKWAMSWHDAEWGQDVTEAPRDGDIAVFKRRSGGPRGEVMGGHVAFWTADLGNRISVLGGNQSNRIKISQYPKNGVMAGTNLFYELLSIRRGW